MAYFFKGNILYNFTVFNFKNKEKIFKYSHLKKKILLTISATVNFTHKIGNSGCREYFPPKNKP